MAEAIDFKYRAFLSYAHADIKWAKWLHGRLEAFRIDKDLAGRTTPLGPVPKSLRPIFRDRDDFTGGHSLTGATIAALDASATLIVLCSPRSAQSKYVNEEIRLFRWRHPERPVIPVMIEGTYPDNFPPALLYEVAADGTVTDRPITLLGPDARETGDGKTLGLSKLVAGLIGVGTDEIVRRAERDHRRRMRNWVAGLSAVVVALAGLTVWAEINRREAVAQRELAERNFAVAKQGANSLIFDIAQSLRNQEGMRTETVRKILGSSEQVIADLVKSSGENPELSRSQAAMLTEFADTYAAQGDSAKQAETLGSSRAILERLLKTDPKNSGWQSDLAVAHSKMGDLRLFRGQYEEALESYRTSLGIVERLAAAEPSDGDLQSKLAASYDRVGTVLNFQKKRPEALAAAEKGRVILEQLTAGSPPQAHWQRDLAVSYAKIADLLVEEDKPQDALARYRKGLAIGESVAAADPGNARWQHDMAAIHSKIGDVLKNQNDGSGAQKSFEASFAILERLAKADPTNTDRQYDLAVARERLAAAAFESGRLDAALQMYRDNLQSMVPLRDGDPTNVGFQRTTAVALRYVGDILVAQHKPAEARKSYEDSLAVGRHLAALEPGNTLWQNDVSIALDKLATVLADEGKLPEALQHRQEHLTIVERLVAAEPGIRDHETDLVSGYGYIGVVLQQMDRTDEAGTMLRKARSTAVALLERSAGNTKLQKLIDNFDQALVLLEAKVTMAIDAAAAAGRYGEALRLQEKRAAEVEADEVKASGKPGNLTAEETNETVWRALFAGEHAKAAEAAERARSLGSGTLSFELNRAHALMFNGRADEARALYLAHKDKPLSDADNKPWQQAVGEDFAELLKAGLAHPMMAEIEAALGIGAR